MVSVISDTQNLSLEFWDFYQNGKPLNDTEMQVYQEYREETPWGKSKEMPFTPANISEALAVRICCDYWGWEMSQTSTFLFKELKP